VNNQLNCASSPFHTFAISSESERFLTLIHCEISESKNTKNSVLVKDWLLENLQCRHSLRVFECEGHQPSGLYK